MDNARELLKRAFIDSASADCDMTVHKFSDSFDDKIFKLFKKRQGVFYKFTDTTGKRTACVVLAAVIMLTAAACSIKKIREPALESIQNFFVNAREFLTGTKADEVAYLFPNEVTKIVGTSFVSESNNKYIISDEHKIKEFMDLLSQTHWGEPNEYDVFGEINTYWTFEFFDTDDNAVLKIDMCKDTRSNNAKITVTSNGELYRFYISSQIYARLLAFTNKELYLHDSGIALPDATVCNKRYNEATSGIDQAQIKEIKDLFRDTHYDMEIFLINNTSILKEYDSVYWQYCLSGEEFSDPITGQHKQITAYKDVEKNLEKIATTIYDKQSLQAIMRAAELWQNAIINHDLEGLFKAHEYIHDYDYFVFNYPTKYVYNPDADFQGVNDYFGHIG